MAGEPVNIDARLEDADWPKRTADRAADLRERARARAAERAAAGKPPLAILGTDATDEEIDSFVAALVGDQRSERFDPHQPRRPDGKWGGGGAISPRVGPETKLPREGHFGTDDPTRMENLPPDHQAKVEAQLQKGVPGLTAEKMDENLEAVLSRADPATVEAGKRWYSDANAAAQEIADKYGYDQDQAIGAIAGTSPQHEWGSNLAVADYVGKAVKENPTIPEMNGTVTKERTIDGVKQDVTKTYEEWARDECAKKGVDFPENVVGTKLADHPPEVQAALIKAMGTSGAWGTSKPGEALQFKNDRTGQMNGCAWSCGINGVADAVRIYRGESVDSALGGHKVRSFYNNIRRPGEGGFVTIDTHAVSAAAGTKLTANSKEMKTIMGTTPSNAYYGVKATYPVIADSYRRVAEKHGLAPNEAQAIIWLQWRNENG